MSQVLARFRNSWIPHGLIVTVILTVVVGFVCLTVRRANMGLADLNENKRARQTIATVKRKEKIRIDERNNLYVGDLGEVIHIDEGTEQLRVYYEIDNFDQFPEPKRDLLMETEKVRISKFGFRFRVLQESAYNSLNEGDLLEVSYRIVGNEKEIMSVTKVPE